MTLLYWIIAFVIAQRLLELLIANYNTRRLLAAGGCEHGARHYLIIVALHVAWIASLVIFVPSEQPANTPLIILFFLLQLGRVWVIASLGARWTTRIISLPGQPLVKRGPYRWIKHPNYVVVVLEILILPLAFDAWQMAVIFSVLNAGILYHRIRVENAVLADASVPQPPNHPQ